MRTLLLLLILCATARGATVTGLVWYVTGQNYSTNVVFTPLSTPTVNSNAIVGSVPQLKILTNGGFSIYLLPGDYLSQIGSPRDRFKIEVPTNSNANTYNWKDLIVDKLTFTGNNQVYANTLLQTNGVNIGAAGTVNFTAGVTGYLAGVVANLGVSASGGGGGSITGSSNMVGGVGLGRSTNGNLIELKSVAGTNGTTVTTNDSTVIVDGSAMTNHNTIAFQSDLTGASNTLRTAAQTYANGVTNSSIVRQADLTGASNTLVALVGETNWNGEVSVTNATRMGLVNGKSNNTNLLRSVQGGNGIVNTNQGTNLMFAVDPVVVASQANLTSASNTLNSALVSNDTTTSNGLVTFIYGQSGRTNYNGEVSKTNATVMGLVYDQLSDTNRLRSISAGNGLVGTNQSTNIIHAIDPAVVASQANLTAASNTLNTAITGASLTTNANQFLGVPLSIIDGALLTNVGFWGSITQQGAVSIPGMKLNNPLMLANGLGIGSVQDGDGHVRIQINKGGNLILAGTNVAAVIIDQDGNVKIRGTIGSASSPQFILPATNGNSGVSFSVPVNALRTNNFIMDIGDFLVGQVLSAQGVSGQTVTLTNTAVIAAQNGFGNATTLTNLSVINSNVIASTGGGGYIGLVSYDALPVTGSPGLGIFSSDLLNNVLQIEGIGLRTVNGAVYIGNASSLTNFQTSLTNATHFDPTAGIKGLKTISAGNGITVTNESGTNNAIAIDPAIVASQANLTTVSNSAISGFQSGSNLSYTLAANGTNQGNANSVAASNLSYTIGTASTNYANQRQFGDAKLTNIVNGVGSALTGGLLDATLTNWFRVPVGVNTNIYVTNLAIGQWLRIDIFCTNGFTCSFPQMTAGNSAAGWVKPLSSNNWDTVYIGKSGTGETNFDVRSADQLFTAGNFVTITTNVNAVTIAVNNVQSGSQVTSNMTGLASTVFTNVPLGGTNISVRTTGGTNFFDTIGNLNNWSQIPTGAMANVVSANFLTNWANAVSNYVTSATQGLANASSMTQTNFVINQIYTNASANPVLINSSVFQTLSAVSGASEIDLMYSPTGAIGYTIIGKAAIGSTALSVAMSYTNSILGVITNQGNYYFTNTSSGAGDTAGLVAGTGQITVFGGVGPAGPAGAAGSGGGSAFQIQTQSVAVSVSATQLNVITPGWTGIVANSQVTIGSTLPDFQQFTNNGTWTKPQGATFVEVVCVGGGGGGGAGFFGATNATETGGGGGGGGAYATHIYRASDISSPVTITIGTNGVGGIATSGSAGGNSTFGSYLTSYGGGGGKAGNGAGNNSPGGGGGGTGGAGGLGGATTGASGLPGPNTVTASGGGGGQGGTLTAGSAEYGGGGGSGNSIAGLGGGGGSSIFGAGGGGNGGAINASGTNTFSFPGGISGSYTTGGGGTNGVAGSSSPGGVGPAGDSTKCGGGGGGGGALLTASGTGGAGGSGGNPGGGGGGGGAGTTGGAGGAGGNGCFGAVRIFSW